MKGEEAVTTNNSEAREDLLPKYTASERPVTRGTRIAFQLWVICLLFTLVVTLTLYLIDKFTG